MQHSIAVVFPGQGSQSVGMLNQLYQQENSVRLLFEKASDILNYNLWDLIQNGPVEVLNQTEKTQPALLVAGYAIWQILHSELHLKPQYLAGHSLGEYTALVAADVLSFESAVQLVANRGRYMQQAVPLGIGAMAAIIGLEEDKVLSICQQATSEKAYVAPANYNALGQIVIAGYKEGVLYAIALALEKNAILAKEIPVSAPSHCQLMKPAAEKLMNDLSLIEFHSANIPIIQNVDAKVHKTASDIKSSLVKQLDHPVRWVETIQFMKKQGIQTIIEAGPGKVLNGLIKRIESSLELYSTADLADIEKLKIGVC